MHTVIIDGSDLDYFQSIVATASNGGLGELTAVQLYVNDNGRIVLGTNGFTSAEIGRPTAPLAHPNDTDGVTTFGESGSDAEANQVAALANGRMSQEEGSGNPYANVTEYDPANVLPRLDRLERFAQGMAQRYDLDLPVLKTV